MVKQKSETKSSSVKQNSSGLSKKTAWIIVGVVIFFGIVIASFFIFSGSSVSFKLYEKNGISIKYPSDWQYFEQGMNTTDGLKTILFSKSLLGMLGGSVSLSIDKNSNTTLEQDFAEISAGLAEAGEKIKSSIQEVTLAGFPAKRISIVSSEQGIVVNIVMILVADLKGTKYSLSLLSTGDASNVVSIFNEMAKSLKIK